MFIREVLLRERNEVTDECMRDRRIGRRRPSAFVAIAASLWVRSIAAPMAPYEAG
jgi:hypothetical protein